MSRGTGRFPNGVVPFEIEGWSRLKNEDAELEPYSLRYIDTNEAGAVG
jgi:hypothetical protein